MWSFNAPRQGSTIPTGIETERSSFECSTVFFADAYCGLCNANHRWFARDAWIEEPRAAQAA